jgi:uncharacterized protein YbjT (DUF2867 family)
MGGEQTAMKVLVTGGGGFLGKAIVERLVKRGCKVRSLSRSIHSDLDKSGVDSSLGDLADAGAVERAVDGCELVFHVAAKPGVWGRYHEYYLPNVVGTNNILAACRKYGVKKLHEHPQRRSLRSEPRKRRRVPPVRRALRNPLSANESRSRTGGACGGGA